MLPMLVVKRRMNIIKQPSKGDNVCQNPCNIIQLSNNNNLKNTIKRFFYVTLHHGPIRVKVVKGSNAKKDGLITFKGSIPQTDGKIGALETTPEVVGQWND